MSPRLARRGYFLGVLNEPDSIHSERIAADGPLAGEMYRLLVMLAQRLRDKTPCSQEELDRLNCAFDQYSAVRLKVVPQADDDEPIFTAGRRGPLERATLQAVLGAAGAGRGRRVYFEAIVSLLETLEEGTADLGTCVECAAWFLPYSRAPVTKFCSARCRNRHNYKVRRAESRSGPGDLWT